MGCEITSVQKRRASADAQNKGEGKEYVEVRMTCDGVEILVDLTIKRGNKIGLGVFNPITDKEREVNIPIDELKG